MSLRECGQEIAAIGERGVHGRAGQTSSFRDTGETEVDPVFDDFRLSGIKQFLTPCPRIDTGARRSAATASS